jgi:hypothetical protein
MGIWEKWGEVLDAYRDVNALLGDVVKVGREGGRGEGRREARAVSLRCSASNPNRNRIGIYPFPNIRSRNIPTPKCSFVFINAYIRRTPRELAPSPPPPSLPPSLPPPLPQVTPSSKCVGDLAIYLVTRGVPVADLLEDSKAAAMDFPASVVELMEGRLGFPHRGFPVQVGREGGRAGGREGGRGRGGSERGRGGGGGEGARVGGREGGRE